MQFVLRLRDGNDGSVGLGILMLGRNGDDLTRSDIVGESSLVMGGDIAYEHKIVANTPVWVIPVTFNANVERDFVLTAYASFAIEFTEC